MNLVAPPQCYLAAGRVHRVSNFPATSFTNHHGCSPPQTAGPFSSPAHSTLNNNKSSTWGILRAVSCSAGPAATTPSPSPSSREFSVYRVIGDGKCLFRALAQGAYLAELEDSGWTFFDFMPVYKETKAADSLRLAVCEELERREEEFAPFIDLDEAGSFSAYVERMKKYSTWGGEPELAVAASVLGRPISVYMERESGGGVEQVSVYAGNSSDSSDSEKARLCDVPLLFHGAGHYDLLVKAPILLKSRL